LFSFLPNTRYFGIHIGHQTVTAAYLGSFGKPAINGVGVATLKRTPWLKTGLRDNEQLTAAITEAITKAQPRPIQLTQVVLTLPETSVFTKAIKLPALSNKELLQTIPFEAAEALPLPLEEVYLDWQIDDHRIAGAKGEKPTIRVLVVAAPKKTVDDLTSVINNAGLTLVGLESEPFSLVRALQPQLKQKTVSIICAIGHETTTTVVANRDHIKFTSTLLSGKKSFQANPKEGIARLAHEINESIKYYRNRLGEQEEIQQVIITGEGALLPGISEGLEREVKIPCQIGRPDINLPGETQIHPRYTTAFGVSLWTKNT
jgi:type IV pilus assembly protein PilM